MKQLDKYLMCFSMFMPTSVCELKADFFHYLYRFLPITDK